MRFQISTFPIRLTFSVASLCHIIVSIEQNTKSFLDDEDHLLVNDDIKR